MKSRSSREWELLEKKLDNNLKNLLPKSLWMLVAEYWPIFRSLRCPISGKPLYEPVWIRHPEIAQIQYDATAVGEYIQAGMLKHLYIRQANAWTYTEVKPHRLPILLSNSSQKTELGRLTKMVFENDFKDLESIPINMDIDLYVNKKLNIKHELDLFVEEQRQLNRSTINLLNFLNQFGFNSEYDLPYDIPHEREWRCRRDSAIAYVLITGLLGNVFFSPVIRYGDPRLFLYASFFRSGPILLNLAYYLEYVRKRGSEAIKGRNPLSNLFFIAKLMLLAYIPLLVKVGNNSLFPLLITPEFFHFIKNLIAQFVFSEVENCVGYDVLKRRFESKLNVSLREPLTLLCMLPALGSILFSNMHDYNLLSERDIHYPLLYLTPRFFCQVFTETPRNLLMASKAADDINELIKNPRSLFETKRDAMGFSESRFDFEFRNMNRLLASITTGVILYCYTENPILALLSCLSVFINHPLGYEVQTSWAPTLFQLPKRQSSVIIEEIDDLEHKQQAGR